MLGILLFTQVKQAFFPLAIPLIVAGAQLAYGAYQSIKGSHDKAALGDQPQETIPDEVYQNLSLAKRQALQGLPEAQRQLYLQNIARSSARAMNMLSDRKAGIAGVNTEVSAENDAYNKLLAQDSQARVANQLRLYGMNEQMAGWKDRMFKQNILMPWQRKYGEAQNMIGAGTQNIGNALGTGASMFMGMPSGANGLFSTSKYYNGKPFTVDPGFSGNNIAPDNSFTPYTDIA